MTPLESILVDDTSQLDTLEKKIEMIIFLIGLGVPIELNRDMYDRPIIMKLIGPCK